MSVNVISIEEVKRTRGSAGANVRIALSESIPAGTADRTTLGLPAAASGKAVGATSEWA